MLDQEVKYKILKILENDSEISQRQLAKALDISLGKINYCVKALIQKGFVKAKRFKNSSNKKAYFYMLTPSGLEEKAKTTSKFLLHKMDEYERLREEIVILRAEIEQNKQRTI